jgi:hypothetical protein
MPDIYIDGNFDVAERVGAAIPEIPFPTDPQAYVYHVPYWQKKTAYAPMGKDVAGPFGGFSTGVDKSHTDVGGGIISFHREFAFVPRSRNQYERFVYPFQVWKGGDSPGVQEFPYSVNSRIQFDYFQTTDPDSIDQPRAPRVIDVFGRLFFQNGFGPPGGGTTTWGVSLSNGGLGHTVGQIIGYSDPCISFSIRVTAIGPAGSLVAYEQQGANVCNPANITNPYAVGDPMHGGAAFNLFSVYQAPSGAEILAEDAEAHLWKGNIYERRQRFIKWVSDYTFLLGS